MHQGQCDARLDLMVTLDRHQGEMRYKHIESPSLRRGTGSTALVM
ncbi:hypothetical protein [uncultured Tateyamaria sp.]|nr:hypothetical protein [uncultured Tateyamaria sp.]